MYRKALSLDDVLASAVVCEPLRLLMLCAPNEGAAAVVVSARPQAADPGAHRRRRRCARTSPDRCWASTRRSTGSPASTSPTPTERAARAAYEVAGLGPEDLDVAEVQDTDAAREILSAEELGLCPRARRRPLGARRRRRDGLARCR